jgi:hypothetical protein
MTELKRDPVKLAQISKELDRLSAMVDRVTKNDITNAAMVILDCANDIQDMLRGKLRGCKCQQIDRDDGGSYLIYNNDCVHHGFLARERERVENWFKDEQARLEDSRLWKLVEAAMARPDLDAQQVWNFAKAVLANAPAAPEKRSKP